MANRFSSPNQQFFVNPTTGAPLAGGKLLFFASGTSTPLNVYSDQALTAPRTNPVILDAAGQAGDVFLQNLAYKVQLTDSNNVTIWTADPVYSSDFSTYAAFQVNAGSPNGTLGGVAGAGSVPSSVVWDNVNNILYVCTQTGVAGVAVWTAVNATASAAIVPPPQGYITPVSQTPIITSDSISASSLFYTPYQGNLCPIYNGSSFTPTVFSELTLTLASQHLANLLYDVFLFNNLGTPTVVTGPAWTTSTAGAGARGTGAGTTQLTRINGTLVNTVQMTGRNGATTYTIPANQATYLGTIFIDGVAGQVTCHRSYGQSRKWGIWNAFNRVPIFLKAGDGGGAYTYATNALRASNNNSANSLTTLCGLAEEVYNIQFNQQITINANAPIGNVNVGIGYNTTASTSGTRGYGFGEGSGASVMQTGCSMIATFNAPPSLGINTATSLEIVIQAANSQTFSTQETGMQLSALWRG